MLIYIAGDGLRYGYGLQFLFYTEVGSRDPSPSLCNANMSCTVQCTHQVWNPDPSLYPNPSPTMFYFNYFFRVSNTAEEIQCPEWSNTGFSATEFNGLGRTLRKCKRYEERHRQAHIASSKSA